MPARTARDARCGRNEGFESLHWQGVGAKSASFAQEAGKSPLSSGLRFKAVTPGQGWFLRVAARFLLLHEARACVQGCTTWAGRVATCKRRWPFDSSPKCLPVVPSDPGWPRRLAVSAQRRAARKTCRAQKEAVTGRSRTLSYLAPLLDRLKTDRTATVLLVTPALKSAEQVMLLGHALRALGQANPHGVDH